MKITRLKTWQVPPRWLFLKIETDEGCYGWGEPVIEGRAATVEAAVHELADYLIGQDPHRIEHLWNTMYRAGFYRGGPILMSAIAGIDQALWDLKGRDLGVPVHQLLGGAVRDKMRMYAWTGGDRPSDVGAGAKALVEKGFRQMKSQMGAEDTPAKEVLRMRTLREAVGDDIDIMCDINQLWNVNQAITIGSRVEEYNLFWLEDVVAHDDYQGLARVADALNTPIAAGEYVYGINPFRQLIENRSIDIVMIDLLRVGGITEWRKVAGMAEAFNLPVVSHLVPEIHIQLMGAIPNGLTVEYMPWTLRLFEETPEIVGGEIVVPDRPGLGLRFDQDVIKKYQVG